MSSQHNPPLNRKKTVHDHLILVESDQGCSLVEIQPRRGTVFLMMSWELMEHDE